MGCWPIVMERGCSGGKKIGMRNGAGGFGNKVMVLFQL